MRSRLGAGGQAVLAVLLVVALLAAGCGSSSKSKAAGGTGSTVSAAPKGPSGTPIEVGFVCTCTGPLASATSVTPPTYRAWVDSVNAGGGINGHPVHVTYVDDASNPANGLTQVHQLVEQNHVIAIVDASNTDQVWASYLQQRHIPVVGENISSLLMFENPDFFSNGQTNDSLPVSVVEAAKKVGAKSVGLLYCAESPICQQLVGAERQIGAKLGVPIAYADSISATAPNYTAPCLAAQQAKVGALFVADAPTVALSVAQSCDQQGYHPVLIADDGAVSEKFASSPGWKDGMIAMQPEVPFFVKNTPGTQAMYSAIQKYQPSLLKNPLFNEEVPETWTAGLLFSAAAKAGNLGVGGPPTSAQILQGLYSLHGETLGGMAPPLTFHPNQPNPVDCWFWMRTQNGKFTTPYGLSPVCASPAG